MSIHPVHTERNCQQSHELKTLFYNKIYVLYLKKKLGDQIVMILSVKIEHEHAHKTEFASNVGEFGPIWTGMGVKWTPSLKPSFLKI